MSFEGYYQLLCKNGHYHETDIWALYDETKWKCPICKDKLAWWHTVDLTNGSYEEDESGNQIRIDGYINLEIDIPAKSEECPHCKQIRIIEPERYKIPNEGHRT